MPLNNLSTSAWCKLSKTSQNLLSNNRYVDENVLRLIDFFTLKNQGIYTRIKNSSLHNTIVQAERQVISGDNIALRSIDFIIDTNIPYRARDFTLEYQLLKPMAYIAIITQDEWQNSRYDCCHAKVIGSLVKSGFLLQGLIILTKSQKRLRPYGYPSRFIPNITNQFVVIARKL